MQTLDLSRSINLISLMLIIGCFEGVFIATYLIIKESVKYQANRYLAGLILVVTAVLLPGFTYRIGLLPQFPHVIRFDLVTFFLFGPLALFYVQACSQKGFQFKPILSLHFIPALLAIIYHFPFFLASKETKIEAFANLFLRGDLGIPNWYALSRIFHPVIYLIICIRIIWSYKKHLTNTTSLIDVTFHRWLLFFCGVLLLPVIPAIIIALTNYRIISMTALIGLLFLFIMSIHLAILIKPNLFHVFPHQMLILDSEQEQKEKYENSTLQHTQKERYVETLLHYMETEKPYLLPDLTLSELSKQVNIPTHHLSQIINEKLNCNFLDFINQYRVKETQLKLLDPKCAHYTIISIAYDSGFNSKSTFYTAFKKQTMMTPNEYRRKQELQLS